MYLLIITFKDVQNVLGMTHFVSLSEVQDLCVCIWSKLQSLKYVLIHPMVIDIDDDGDDD